MRFDLRGLWRVLVVLYLASAAAILIAGGVEVNRIFDCRAAEPRLGMAASTCGSIPVVALQVIGGLVATFLVLFGGGLVVRWMYRGFFRSAT